MAFEIFDDVAFFIFITSLLGMVLVPYTFFVYAWPVLCKSKRGSSTTAATDESGTVAGYGGSATDTLGVAPIRIHDSYICRCSTCKQREQLARDKKVPISQYITFHNICFGALWFVFLLLLIQLPNYKHQEMKVFNPFDILGLEAGADESQVKRAYRKMSVKWHPDKNLDEPEKAAEQFILVSKAYQTLTDAQTRENWEKYGNPDGYKGTSVTIGLPSFLTQKGNQLNILLIYFLMMIACPPIVVWIWWSRRQSIHEFGIHQETCELYAKFITEHMSLKQLIRILSASKEFATIPVRSQDEPEYKKLRVATKEDREEKEWLPQLPYIQKVIVLLTAYMRREPIPECFQGDLRTVLKEAHRLSDAMLLVVYIKKMWVVMDRIIEMKQLLTQAMWQHQSALAQLPGMNDRIGAYAKKKKMQTIEQWRYGNAKTRYDLMKKEGLDPEQMHDVNHVCQILPEMGLDVKYGVQGEEEVMEGDPVTIQITLLRRDPRPHLERIERDLNELIASGGRVSDADEQPGDGSGKTKEAYDYDKNADGWTTGKVEYSHMKGPKYDKELQRRKRRAARAARRAEREHQRKQKSKATVEEIGDGDDDETKADATATSVSDEEDVTSDEEEYESVDLFEEDNDKNKKKTKEPAEDDRIMVHTHETYPWAKEERWQIFLRWDVPEGSIVVRQPVPALRLNTPETVELRIPSPKVPRQHAAVGSFKQLFRVEAKCDSYVGCDVALEFKMDVRQKPMEVLAREQERGPSEEWDAISDEEDASWWEIDEDEEYIPQWYYLGMASFTEMVLTLFVFGVMGFLLYTVLQNNGMWDKYFVPIGSFIWRLASPVVNPLMRLLSPILSPFWDYFLGPIYNVLLEWSSVGGGAAAAGSAGAHARARAQAGARAGARRQRAAQQEERGHDDL